MSPESPAHEIGVAAHLIVSGVALESDLHIDGDDGHHLGRVRRLRKNEHVTVGDGAGSWRRYAVVATSDGALDITATAEEHFEAVQGRWVTIAAAISKGTKLEDVAMHLTEVGVSEIRPIQMARSIVRLDDVTASKLTTRLVASVRAGAMQSRRAWLPKVHRVAALESLVGTENLFVAAHDGNPGAIDDIALDAALTVVTGPEGGIDPTERELLASMGAQTWSVGRYVLRAETAPLVATISAKQ